ncbi:hypothetical protein EWM64_g4180 [Hericium alpestre]|uniref:Importin N-terminal domain-containing protein n=1 Tax=Hericium alpestre TaxID=135208 RepID=A0A4Y9ZYD5_9AGAM|nr:hypothetical protein EWM64_g4180 [Hericium alpestre]
MASTADIAQLLSSTLNPDPNVRMAAELKLSETLANPEHWSPYFQQFKGNAPPVEVKSQIRSQVFQGLSDPLRKIRSLCALTLSRIATCDWPDEYPDLLTSLLGLLSSGSPTSVHGAMQVFTEFIRNELTEVQILPVLRQLLPVLLNILGASEQHTPITRSRTVAVFRQCVEALYMVKEQHPQAVKEASSTVLPVWLDAFKVLLQLDPRQDVSGEHWDGLAVRIQIFRTLDTIHTSFPRAIASYLPAYLAAGLAHLQTLFPTFYGYYLSPNPVGDVPQSEDEGEIVELTKLAAPLIDFVSSVARAGRARTWFDEPGQLGTLIVTLVKWAQITRENEDDDTQAYSVRVAVFDLLSSLLGRDPAPTAAALNATSQAVVAESRQAREAGNADWWRPLEGLLAVIGSQSETILECLDDEKESGRAKPIDIEDLLAEVIPSLLTLSECPFLQGRCLVFASRYAKLLPLNISGQYLDAALQVIESSETGIPFKISAVKAIHYQWLTVDLANDVILALLEVWMKNIKDPIFLSILTDIFSSIAGSSTPGVYETAVKQALPKLTLAIGNTNPEQSWIASSAIELASALVEGAPEGGLGEGFFATVAPSLFECLKVAEDRDVLQNGVRLLTLIVRKDVSQLLAWTDANGQPGLGNTLNVIARLLQNQDESGGLFVGDLIIHLLRRAGDAVLPVLPDLLEAMVSRMRTAKTATFLQSLIIPFAFLIYSQRDVILNLLEAIHLDDGRTGLDVLINTWCENAETFQGLWPMRVSSLALCQLFLAERPSLQGLMVKGDIIVKPETRNVPLEFTSIPFPVKALKLLLHDLQTNGEAASMSAPGGLLDVDSDDGDEEWTEEEKLNQGFKEDEFAFLSDVIGVKGSAFDDDDILDETDDEELRNDPISQIDLREHTINFLQECASRGVGNFPALVDQLSAEETVVIKRVLQPQGQQ